MSEYIYSKKAVISYFIVVIILSAIFQTLYCKGNDAYMLLVMYSPAFACIIANIVNFIDKKEKFNLKLFLNRCGFKRCNLLYIVMGLIIPFLYLYVSYRIYWFMYPDNYAYTGVSVSLILKDCFLYTIICVIGSFFSAIGEEIGWRGFMFPALNERLGNKKALIISSIIWCVWHFPLMIFGDYMQETTLIYSLIAFVLCIMPVGIICGLLSLESNSMLPCAFLHAAHNAYDQSLFSLLTRGENMLYFVSETGIFTIICVWIIAIIMFLRAKKEGIINE